MRSSCNLGDLLPDSPGLVAPGDVKWVLTTTVVEYDFADKDRSVLSFFSRLPRSGSDVLAGVAIGFRFRCSSIGVRTVIMDSSSPPLPLLFRPKVAVDSDVDWAVEGAASASSTSSWCGEDYTVFSQYS